jgi:hypothetical protein
MDVMTMGRLRFLSIVAGAALAGACSQSPSQLSQVGPSAAAPGAAGASGWSTSGAAADTGFSLAAANGKKKVSGAGTVASLTGNCDDGLRMVVQGVRVETDSATVFYIDATEQIEGGCGNLRPGTKVKVEAGAEPTANGSYLAETITIVDQPGGPPPADVAGDGTVAALKGTCPTLTMVVHGYPVMTVSSTVFSGSGYADSDAACAALKPGTRVHVEGVLGGNSVVADTVEILAPATP